MSVTERDASVGYRFPAPDGLVWLGLGAGPLAVLGVTLAATVALLVVGAPLVLPVVCVAAGGVSALTPVRGRAVSQWAPWLVRHALAVARRAHRVRLQPGGCAVVVDAAGPLPERSIADLRVAVPGAGRGLRWVELDGIGVLDDRAAGRQVVLLRVAGGDRLGLLPADEQDRVLAGWGEALSALVADPALRSAQWVERNSPDVTDHGAWLRDRAAAADVSGVLPAVPGAIRRGVWLALGFERDPRGPEPVAQAVGGALRALAVADLLARPLSAREGGAWLRNAVTPGALDDGGERSGSGRVAVRRGWAELRCGDVWHRAWAVSGWPRALVPAGWWEPLLLAPPGQGVARTVSVHLAPVPPVIAARRARAAAARADAERGERARLGLAGAGGVEAAAVAAAETERELLAGHRLLELSGVVLLSAPSREALDAAARELTAVAAGCRLGLQPLHGAHDRGLLAALPLARPAGGPR